MSSELVTAVDPLKDSLDHLLAVSFSKSTSQVYPLAVNIAEGAAKYLEIEVNRKPVHLVAFAKNREDAARALALVNYVSGWKTTQIFAGGKVVQNPYEVTQVLDCYLEASACNDRSAHCHTVIDDPYNEEVETSTRGVSIRLSLEPGRLQQRVEIDRYVFPCSFLKGRFRFQVDHPASPHDQIQAAGVKQGCAWCPFFDPSEYSKTGTRVTSKPVFT
jgi:hypothetical protein